MSIDKKTFGISEIAETIGAELSGECAVDIRGVNSLDQASAGEISFVSKDKMKAKALESKASGLIVSSRIEGFSGAQLIVENVDAALIKAMNLFVVELPVEPGIDSRAVVDASAEIGDNVSVGPLASIGRNTTIGSGSIIGSGCSIGDDVVIGNNCRIDANVVIYRRCAIGNNCVIQANTTIGSCGFGYSLIDGQHRLIPHNGGVIIEDCVEIGANCSVDRAKFGNTKIGAGTKIDNLVMIAHNVLIGRCCLVVAQSGIAGSSIIGDGAVLAGKAGVGDNVTIGDGTVVTARASVFKDYPAGSTLSGTPARPMKDHLRQMAALQRLPQMVTLIKELINKVQDLEASKDNKE